MRRIEVSELPLRIGTGPTADIRVPGPVSGEIVGLVGSLDDRPFLQPTGAAAAFAVNGEPLIATRWLAEGDVVTCGALRIECHFDDEAARLSVAYTDTEYATLPPVDETAGARGPAIAAVRRQAAEAGPPSRLRRSWLIYGALALLAVTALYLFTAKAVRIEVDPSDADIVVSNGLALELGGRYLLHTGRYHLRLAAPGYEPAEHDIEVGTASAQEFRYELRKLPGRLAIEAGAAGPLRVSIDGKPATPAADGHFVVPPGKHALVVAAPRYQDYTTTIEIEGRELLQTLRVALKPNWADVTVASEPPGATIAIGDEVLGQTPAVVPVVAGGALLELRKEGYKPWRQNLSVTAGEKQELPLVRLQEVDGLLAVASAPAGAAVTIDGRFRGTTPLEAEISSGRRHDVIVAKPGYETVTRVVEVARRGSASLRLDLEQRVGVVRIESDPADAELLVNGAPRGAASQELSLPAIPQRLEVRKAGLVSFVTELTPTPGMPQVVKVKLLSPEQAVLAATPQTITTKQGQVLRLIGPGDFEMGAPRREQGRRPNETQRPVRITRRYYIGTREISNREFREFKPRHTSGADVFQELAAPEHPAVMLSWEEAATFCNWLSERESLPKAYALKDGKYVLADPLNTGYRLPSEAEWEWAGRYNGGGRALRYPWGATMPPAPRSGNYADQSARGLVANVLAGYDDGFPATAPVGSFPPGPLGLYDIGGNVAEWVSDFYSVYAGGATGGPAVDPVGPPSGQYHAIRGSGWRHSSISELRLAFRDFGDQGRLDVGFRIARSVE